MILVDGSAPRPIDPGVFGDELVRHATYASIGVTTKVRAPVGILLKTALAGCLIAIRHRQLGRFASQQTTACKGTYGFTARIGVRNNLDATKLEIGFCPYRGPIDRVVLVSAREH